jgi:hypothetical protein
MIVLAQLVIEIPPSRITTSKEPSVREGRIYDPQVGRISTDNPTAKLGDPEGRVVDQSDGLISTDEGLAKLEKMLNDPPRQ